MTTIIRVKGKEQVVLADDIIPTPAPGYLLTLEAGEQGAHQGYYEVKHVEIRINTCRPREQEPAHCYTTRVILWCEYA